MELTPGYVFQDEKDKYKHTYLFKKKAADHAEKHRREHIMDLDEEHLEEAAERIRDKRERLKRK